MHKISNLRNILIGVVTLIILGACGETANLTSPELSNSAATSSPVATTPPAHPLIWKTIQSFTGNGDKKTATFQVPDHWRIVWTCNPNSFDGLNYNLMADVKDQNGGDVDLGALNTMCSSSNSHDDTEEYKGGTVYLDVNSEAYWQIQVQTQQ